MGLFIMNSIWAVAAVLPQFLLPPCLFGLASISNLSHCFLRFNVSVRPAHNGFCVQCLTPAITALFPPTHTRPFS
ncbi:hypothetical protein J3F83DRAFT_730823 [Trichoderma novae-zelandiae]